MKVLRDLKLDNDTIDKVGTLVKYHLMELPDNEVLVRKALSIVDVAPLKDILAFEKLYYEVTDNENKVLEVKNTKVLVDKIIARGDCFRIKDLAINGGDLINAGVKPGKEMGAILKKCLEVVIENPEMNTVENLLKMI